MISTNELKAESDNNSNPHNLRAGAGRNRGDRGSWGVKFGGLVGLTAFEDNLKYYYGKEIFTYGLKLELYSWRIFGVAFEYLLGDVNDQIDFMYSNQLIDESMNIYTIKYGLNTGFYLCCSDAVQVRPYVDYGIFKLDHYEESANRSDNDPLFTFEGQYLGGGITFDISWYSNTDINQSVGLDVGIYQADLPMKKLDSNISYLFINYSLTIH